jgi:hypothetical protein
LRRENWLQRRERYWPRWKCFKMLHGQLVYLNLFTNKSLSFWARHGCWKVREWWVCCKNVCCTTLKF